MVGGLGIGPEGRVIMRVKKIDGVGAGLGRQPVKESSKIGVAAILVKIDA